MEAFNKSIYLQSAKGNYLRLLGSLNLDVNTETYGSFDRIHWGWKKRDFEDSTLCFAMVPMIKALELGVFEIHRTDLHKIVLDHLLKIQRRNGSFDQSYPNEGHPKVGLDLSQLYYLILKRDKSDSSVMQSYLRLMKYSLHSEETYGKISNHLAHHSYEYLCAFDLTGDKEFYKHALKNIYQIKEWTDTEGWHQEYSGADPGYQTRALKYLVKCLPILNGSDRELCFELCLGSARFLKKAIMPDGTIYSGFGSRNTSIIYPSGIEWMASKLPDEFSELAARVRSGIEKTLTMRPEHLEFDNFIRLFDDYLEAYSNAQDNVLHGELDKSSWSLDSMGLCCFSFRGYKIYIHKNYGGSTLVYRGGRLLFKDGGVLVSFGKSFYGSKNIDSPSWVEGNPLDGELLVKSRGFKSAHREVSPAKQIVLRILNYSILRVSPLSDLFRKFVVRMLMTGRGIQSPASFTRRIKITDNELAIEDEVHSNSVPDCVYKVTCQNLIHMASSRYGGASDLQYSGYIVEKLECDNLKNSFFTRFELV